MADTTRDERDALLDALAADIDTWHERETKVINAEIEFVKSVVKARSSTQRLVSKNTERARLLAINDITTFLAGEG